MVIVEQEMWFVGQSVKRYRTCGYRKKGDVVIAWQEMWLVGHSVKRYRACGYRRTGDVVCRAKCEEIQDMWLS